MLYLNTLLIIVDLSNQIAAIRNASSTSSAVPPNIVNGSPPPSSFRCFVWPISTHQQYERFDASSYYRDPAIFLLLREWWWCRSGGPTLIIKVPHLLIINVVFSSIQHPLHLLSSSFPHQVDCCIIYRIEDLGCVIFLIVCYRAGHDQHFAVSLVCICCPRLPKELIVVFLPGISS